MIRARAEVEPLTPYVAPLEGRRPMLRLDFNDQKAQKIWLAECEKFFFGEGSAVPEGYVPPPKAD